MKNIFYALVFVLSGVAFAEQQPLPPKQQQPVPPQQEEVVEFSTLFKVFVCTKVQQDYKCDEGEVAPEKVAVKLEKSAHDGLLKGILNLESLEIQGYKHDAEIFVMKHTTAHGTHYGFHLSESFAKVDAQPSDLVRTYGSIHMDCPENLNEVAYYGRITVDGDKLYVPVLIIAPANAQARTMKVNPSVF